MSRGSPRSTSRNCAGILIRPLASMVWSNRPKNTGIFHRSTSETSNRRSRLCAGVNGCYASRSDDGIGAESELQRELGGDELFALLEIAALVLVAVLELRLDVAVQAASDGGVDAPGVLVPGAVVAVVVLDVTEELLIPA